MRAWLSLKASGRILLPWGRCGWCGGLGVTCCFCSRHPGSGCSWHSASHPSHSIPSFWGSPRAHLAYLPFWSASGQLLASAPSLILENPTQPLPLSLLRLSSSPVLQQPCLTLVRSQLSVVPHPAGDTVTSSQYIRCHSGPSWVHNFCPGPTLAEHWLALGMRL